MKTEAAAARWWRPAAVRSDRCRSTSELLSSPSPVVFVRTEQKNSSLAQINFCLLRPAPPLSPLAFVELMLPLLPLSLLFFIVVLTSIFAYGVSFFAVGATEVAASSCLARASQHRLIRR